MASVKISALFSNNSDLREQIAAKLNSPMDAVPEEKVNDLAKALDLLPKAVCKSHTTTNGKTSAYIVTDGPCKGRADGGAFSNFGAPDAELTPAHVALLTDYANGFADVSDSMRAIADRAEALLAGDADES